MADLTKKVVRRQDQKEFIVKNTSKRNGNFFDIETADSVYHDADRVPTFFAGKEMVKEVERGFQPTKPILWSHGKNTKKRYSKENTMNPTTEYSDVVARKPRPISCESYEQNYAHQNPKKTERACTYDKDTEDRHNEHREARQNLKRDEDVSPRQPLSYRNKGSYAHEYKKKTTKVSLDSGETANQGEFIKEKSYEDLKMGPSKDSVVEEQQSSPKSNADDKAKCVPGRIDNDPCSDKVNEERASFKSKNEGSKVKPKPRWNSNFQKPEYPNIYAPECPAVNENNDSQKSNSSKKNPGGSSKKFVKKEGAFPKRYTLHDRPDRSHPDESHTTKSHARKQQARKSHNEKSQGEESHVDKGGEESKGANKLASESHPSASQTTGRHSADSYSSRSHLERQTSLPGRQSTSLINFEAVKKKHASCCKECVSARARSADHVRTISRENRRDPLSIASLTITEEDELEKSMVFINDAVNALGMMQKLMDNVGSTKSFLEKIYDRLGNSRDVARCRENAANVPSREELDEKERDSESESDASSIEEVLDYQVNESVRVYEPTSGRREDYHWEPRAKTNAQTKKGAKKDHDKSMLELSKAWEKRNPDRKYSRY